MLEKVKVKRFECIDVNFSVGNPTLLAECFFNETSKEFSLLKCVPKNIVGAAGSGVTFPFLRNWIPP